ncbi:MAG: YqgE/AlgH family protein, partial [SAR324 cluster bacterium]|nr:YqgE/AlgH family protein [SAR324 cluster bacterium]
MLVSEVPGILVAMPELKDTYFEESVILLCSYNTEGAFGLVMNHPS